MAKGYQKIKKESYDIMWIDQYINKYGKSSYCLRCSGKDPDTHKNKVYVSTHDIPDEIIDKKKELKEFRIKIQLEFKEEVDGIYHKTLVGDRKPVKFMKFAKEYVEDIIKGNPQSYHRYSAHKSNLKVLEQKLSHFYLHEVNQFVVQDFCEWLCNRTYTKTTVTVIKSLKPYIKSKMPRLGIIAEKCQIAYESFYAATIVGKTISYNIAAKLCDHLKVPIEEYFDVQIRQVPYSLESNKGVRTLLSVVLARAAQRGLIERNYALSEFVDPLTGTKGEKEIYEGEDLQKFMRCVMAEKDIRKKTAFSILIYLGLRLGEVVGLEFKDINFEKNQIAIMRNTAYVREFGIITKDPKTKSSKAVLTAPQDLMDRLAQYKAWWDNQKSIRGDLWQNTDRLFCQENGSDMSGITVRHWLNDFEQRNNLKHVTPHGLRHTAITMLIDEGVNPKAVSEMARHSRVQTTLDIYTHRTSRSGKDVAKATNRILKVV